VPAQLPEPGAHDKVLDDNSDRRSSQDGWINGLVLFFWRVYGSRLRLGHEKKELGQYPAIEAIIFGGGGGGAGESGDFSWQLGIDRWLFLIHSFSNLCFKVFHIYK